MKAIGRRKFLQVLGLGSSVAVIAPKQLLAYINEKKKTFTEEAIEKFGTGDQVEFTGNFGSTDYVLTIEDLKSGNKIKLDIYDFSMEEQRTVRELSTLYGEIKFFPLGGTITTRFKITTIVSNFFPLGDTICNFTISSKYDKEVYVFEGFIVESAANFDKYKGGFIFKIEATSDVSVVSL